VTTQLQLIIIIIIIIIIVIIIIMTEHLMKLGSIPGRIFDFAQTGCGSH